MNLPNGIKPEEFLSQVDHLLQTLETDDSESKKEIALLRSQVRGLLHIALVTKNMVALDVGLDLLAPQVDDLVQRLTKRDTWPAEQEGMDGSSSKEES